MLGFNETICAIATASGPGAISVIRLSGADAIPICNSLFFGKDLTQVNSHTLHFGTIRENEIIIDEVVVSIFKNPHSYTGEDVVEVSCHGSSYIQNKIIQLFIKNGARMAKAGEFTLRAFSNGKMDLTQAEAVADLIASESESSHRVAIQQMRGGFSNELKNLREQLIEFASLIELELDFGEEDVEFADRQKFNQLLQKIRKVLNDLISSFALGNVMKNGVPVAILGRPNVGKSTLLNVLLNEEKAIVSDIAGTTRDAIEDIANIGGVLFRFIDTAGIRKTEDVVENIGINKAIKKAQAASINLFIVDATQDIDLQLQELNNLKNQGIKNLILLYNKIDLNPLAKSQVNDAIYISAKKKEGIEMFKNKMLELTNTANIDNNQIIVSNNRHLEALQNAVEKIEHTIDGLNNNISGDFLAMDIRQALYHIGEITGEISTDDLLDNIFSNFCIGK